MSILINPGSHIGPAEEGWTNTYEGAVREAQRWLERMRDDGIGDDVDLSHTAVLRIRRGERWAAA